jgi:hypothetical protein
MTPSTETSIPQATVNPSSPAEPSSIPTTANPTSTTVQTQQPSSPQPSTISITPTETPNSSQTPDSTASQNPSLTANPELTSSDQPKIDETKQDNIIYGVLFYGALSSILAIAVLIMFKISKPVQLSNGRKYLQAINTNKEYAKGYEENQGKFSEAPDVT